MTTPTAFHHLFYSSEPLGAAGQESDAVPAPGSTATVSGFSAGYLQTGVANINQYYNAQLSKDHSTNNMTNRSKSPPGPGPNQGLISGQGPLLQTNPQHYTGTVSNVAGMIATKNPNMINLNSNGPRVQNPGPPGSQNQVVQPKSAEEIKQSMQNIQQRNQQNLSFQFSPRNHDVTNIVQSYGTGSRVFPAAGHTFQLNKSAMSNVEKDFNLEVEGLMRGHSPRGNFQNMASAQNNLNKNANINNMVDPLGRSMSLSQSIDTKNRLNQNQNQNNIPKPLKKPEGITSPPKLFNNQGDQSANSDDSGSVFGPSPGHSLELGVPKLGGRIFSPKRGKSAGAVNVGRKNQNKDDNDSHPLSLSLSPPNITSLRPPNLQANLNLKVPKSRPPNRKPGAKNQQSNSKSGNFSPFGLSRSLSVGVGGGAGTVDNSATLITQDLNGPAQSLVQGLGNAMTSDNMVPNLQTMPILSPRLPFSKSPRHNNNNMNNSNNILEANLELFPSLDGGVSSLKAPQISTIPKTLQRPEGLDAMISNVRARNYDGQLLEGLGKFSKSVKDHTGILGKVDQEEGVEGLGQENYNMNYNSSKSNSEENVDTVNMNNSQFGLNTNASGIAQMQIPGLDINAMINGSQCKSMGPGPTTKLLQDMTNVNLNLGGPNKNSKNSANAQAINEPIAAHFTRAVKKTARTQQQISKDSLGSSTGLGNFVMNGNGNAETTTRILQPPRGVQSPTHLSPRRLASMNSPSKVGPTGSKKLKNTMEVFSQIQAKNAGLQNISASNLNQLNAVSANAAILQQQTQQTPRGLSMPLGVSISSATYSNVTGVGVSNTVVQNNINDQIQNLSITNNTNGNNNKLNISTNYGGANTTATGLLNQNISFSSQEGTKTEHLTLPPLPDLVNTMSGNLGTASAGLTSSTLAATDPTYVKSQKDQYLNILEEQVTQAEETVKKKLAYEMECLKVRMDEKKKNFEKELSDKLDNARKNLEQQYEKAKTQLHADADDQKMNLEQQAMKLVLQYEERKQHELDWHQHHETHWSHIKRHMKDGDFKHGSLQKTKTSNFDDLDETQFIMPDNDITDQRRSGGNDRQADLNPNAADGSKQLGQNSTISYPAGSIPAEFKRNANQDWTDFQREQDAIMRQIQEESDNNNSYSTKLTNSDSRNQASQQYSVTQSQSQSNRKTGPPGPNTKTQTRNSSNLNNNNPWSNRASGSQKAAAYYALSNQYRFYTEKYEADLGANHHYTLPQPAYAPEGETAVLGTTSESSPAHMFQLNPLQYPSGDFSPHPRVSATFGVHDNIFKHQQV